MKKIFLVVSSFALLALPAFAFAANAGVRYDVWDPTILRGPLITCSGNYAQGGDPSASLPACTNFCDFISTIENVIYFGIGFVIWILVPIAFASGGISFMLARGNPEKVSGAKKVITGTIIGVLIVICAYLIVSVFVGALGIVGIGGFGGNLCS